MVKLAVSSVFAGSGAHVKGTFFFILSKKKNINFFKTSEIRDQVYEAVDERFGKGSPSNDDKEQT